MCSYRFIVITRILEEIITQRVAMQEDNDDLQYSATVNTLNLSSLILPRGQLEDIPEDPLCEDSEDHDSDLETTNSESSKEFESSEEE
ncbi:hypothetical protein [Arabidopsis thaliana]|uniref:Uncharacterized protein AT4g03710 n=1 Tax=Arabidopsis thaliana TaxID=3702 RepID=Q9SY49_ARATH|nr:hypothetical protein [Arabidopsis thaliana]CAB77856.1 hypothetical protein [Arabidopsis thaliana]